LKEFFWGWAGYPAADSRFPPNPYLCFNEAFLSNLLLLLLLIFRHPLTCFFISKKISST
jgi:hypothetical protein